MQYKTYNDLSIMDLGHSNTFLATDKSGNLSQTEKQVFLNGIIPPPITDIPTYYLALAIDHNDTFESNEVAYLTREACIKQDKTKSVSIGDLAVQWMQGIQFNVIIIFYEKGEGNSTDPSFYDTSYDQNSTVIGTMYDSSARRNYAEGATRWGLITTYVPHYANKTIITSDIVTFTDEFTEEVL